jgi:hypothetical protein
VLTRAQCWVDGVEATNSWRLIRVETYACRKKAGAAGSCVAGSSPCVSVLAVGCLQTQSMPLQVAVEAGIWTGWIL